MASWRPDLTSWRPDRAIWSDSWRLKHVFKRSWVVPQRSGNVPVGSRTRMIDFPLILGSFGREGYQGRANSRRKFPDSLNLVKTNDTPGTGTGTSKVQVQVQVQVQIQVQRKVVKNTHSRRRAKRGSGYTNLNECNRTSKGVSKVGYRF